MSEDVKVNALVVVDRNHIHPQIFVWICDGKWRNDGGDANLGRFAGLVPTAQGRIVKTEISIVNFDTRG